MKPSDAIDNEHVPLAPDKKPRIGLADREVMPSLASISDG